MNTGLTLRTVRAGLKVAEVPITFVDAALGGELEVPTLDGRVKLKIPAETQTGKVFKLSGKGIVSLQGYGRGDQLVILQVEVPTKLDTKQREVLVRRFGLNNHERTTLEDVGKELGVTRERVRQIQMDALKQLRKILENQGFTEELLFQD